MISIIIPLYNKEQTIIGTLNSVFKQTYQDFEVIIVNDGSTDNSIEYITQNFTDKRLKIIHQKNSGVSVARNRGIMESHGEWISFLDGDDEWLPNYLEEVNNAINLFPNNPIVLTGRYSQNYKTKQRSYNIPIKNLNNIKEIDFFENPHVYFHISATTIKTSILKENYKTWGSFICEQKFNEDFTFIFRIALHGKVTYIGKALSIYNGCVTNQATSILKEEKRMKDNILHNNIVINEYKNMKITNRKFEIFMKYAFRHTILQYLKKRNYKSINYYINNLSAISQNILINKFESFLFTRPNINKIGIYYIMLTKVIWRTHKYPRVK